LVIVTTLATLAAQIEQSRDLPAGGDERFAGYGVMGLPFTSGHVLAMRRFPASSIGPAYTSVWHRDPTGRWVFWQDQPDELACPRYFSSALAETRCCAIELDWPGATTMRIAVPEADLEWTATMAASPVSRVLNAVGSVLPDRAWRARPILAALGPVAGAALRAGKVGLAGRVPNGQRFVPNPRQVWLVAAATVRMGQEDFGRLGPLTNQARLGDFWIPQRGLFAIGRAFFAS